MRGDMNRAEAAQTKYVENATLHEEREAQAAANPPPQLFAEILERGALVEKILSDHQNWQEQQPEKVPPMSKKVALRLVLQDEPSTHKLYKYPWQGLKWRKQTIMK